MGVYEPSQWGVK